MLTFREAADEDLPALVDLGNRAHPWEPPLTLDQERHWEATRDASLPRLRLVAEEDGRLVGVGTAQVFDWLPPHLIALQVTVDPPRQRQGIGSALFERLLPFARDHGTELAALISEQDAAGIVFAHHHGFAERYRIFESSLDVAAFDPSPYAGLPARLRAEGVHLTTLAAEDSPEARRAVHDLWRRLFDDVPSPDALRTPPFESWTRGMLEGPSANLESFALAKATHRFVGLAYMSTPPGRPAYNLFTGVERDYREKGLALALKMQTILYARAHGIKEIRTNNNTTNAPMLAVNERLGYRRLAGRIRVGRAP